MASEEVVSVVAAEVAMVNLSIRCRVHDGSRTEPRRRPLLEVLSVREGLLGIVAEVEVTDLGLWMRRGADASANSLVCRRVITTRIALLKSIHEGV